MLSTDAGTIQALRVDVALQVARHFRRSGSSQSAAARALGIPQPTLSKIINGRVDNLSLELLLRVAVRAGLAVTLITGRVPEEAGAFLSNPEPAPKAGSRSKLAEAAREILHQSQRRLTPSQRLEAFVQHNQLMSALRRSADAAAAAKPHKIVRSRT